MASGGMTDGERLERARARFDRIAAAERTNPHVAHASRAFFQPGVAGVAVVLLHGLTNSPPQYDRLGAQLHARGHAVVVPRMPYHGYRDRMTDAVAALRAGDLQAAALEAVAIAALCGRRVVVLGISVGAVVAGWLAARTRIDVAIADAPFCGIRALPGGANDAFGALLRTLPNGFLWWDPRSKEGQPPPHGYPRFATRALGESLRVSTELHAVCGTPAQARRIVLAFNEHEPVVNNAFAERRFRPLRERGIAVERVVLRGLHHIHDIIEPAIPQAQTERVYPALIELIETP